MVSVCEKANPFFYFLSLVSVNRHFGGIHQKGTTLNMNTEGISSLRAAWLSAIIAERMNLMSCVRYRGHLKCSYSKQIYFPKKSLGGSKNSKFGAHQVFKMTSL